LGIGLQSLSASEPASPLGLARCNAFAGQNVPLRARHATAGMARRPIRRRARAGLAPEGRANWARPPLCSFARSTHPEPRALRAILL